MPNLARYEMRMELYRANRNPNDGDDPGHPIGLGQHMGNDGPGPNEQEGLDSAIDEESYARPDDELYEEWLRQLKEEGIEESAMV
ncbi:MAG: hypothetical protein M1839_000180 [Geoglossum umbratile]|nr:MAG: hypothetical protein M1839_000180 [Geoglossum umbratile]